ncbi:MAG: metallophosphatase family protein, partial [Deltaproteobacteria bacterium]|nr:metallophosphatase family protein [Deltaproteobacteria bacterium]
MAEFAWHPEDTPRIVKGPGSVLEPLARFALIGDVHAEDERLEAAIEIAEKEGVERVLCVGDVCDGHGDLARTVTLLESKKVIVVRGNHDRWFLRDEMRHLELVHHRADFPAVARIVGLWPPLVEFWTLWGWMLLCHGVGDEDMAAIDPAMPEDEVMQLPAWQRILSAQKYAIVALGHTHKAMVRSIASITVINPGTLKRDDDPCFGIVDLRRGSMQLYNLSVP